MAKLRTCFLVVLMCLLSQVALCQNDLLRELTAPGKKAYLDFVDVRGNIKEKDEPLVRALTNGEIWGRWELVPNIEEADFVLHVEVEKKGPGFSISYGARMFIQPAVSTVDGKVLWVGSKTVGRAHEFTGFNAYWKACTRMIKICLRKELMSVTNTEWQKNEYLLKTPVKRIEAPNEEIQNMQEEIERLKAENESLKNQQMNLPTIQE